MTDQRSYWPELDVLRGLAVVLMILNHVAVAWLSPSVGGLAAALSFLGSFAPVLFFFVTGCGYGLAHRVGRPGSCGDVLVKAAVLLALDLVLRRGQLGWDFLGFIALSMLVLHLIRGRKHGTLLAAALLGAVLTLRFGLGPLYKSWSHGALLPLAAQMLGLTPVLGVSYWFTPWLAYPLAGFLVGVLGQRYPQILRARPYPISLCLLLLGLAGAGLTAFMVERGASLLRWGMMSLGFFVASLAFLALVSATVLALCASPRLTRLREGLSLRGISSLAVVPLHYGLLELAGAAIQLPTTTAVYMVSILLLVPLCFALARATAALGKRLAHGAVRPRVIALLLGSLLGLVLAAHRPLAALAQLLFFAVELALCLLLAFSYAAPLKGKNEVSIPSATDLG